MTLGQSSGIPTSLFSQQKNAKDNVIYLLWQISFLVKFLSSSLWAPVFVLSIFISFLPYVEAGTILTNDKGVELSSQTDWTSGQGGDGSSMVTDKIGASATFHFTGTKAQLVGLVGPDFGKFQVQLDGESFDVSGENAQASSGVTLFSGEGLDHNHDFELVVKQNDPSGKKVGIQKVEFDEESSSTSASSSSNPQTSDSKSGKGDDGNSSNSTTSFSVFGNNFAATSTSNSDSGSTGGSQATATSSDSSSSASATSANDSSSDSSSSSGSSSSSSSSKSDEPSSSSSNSNDSSSSSSDSDSNSGSDDSSSNESSSVFRVFDPDQTGEASSDDAQATDAGAVSSATSDPLGTSATPTPPPPPSSSAPPPPSDSTQQSTDSDPSSPSSGADNSKSGGDSSSGSSGKTTKIILATVIPVSAILLLSLFAFFFIRRRKNMNGRSPKALANSGTGGWRSRWKEKIAFGNGEKRLSNFFSDPQFDFVTGPGGGGGANGSGGRNGGRGDGRNGGRNRGSGTSFGSFGDPGALSRDPTLPNQSSPTAGSDTDIEALGESGGMGGNYYGRQPMPPPMSQTSGNAVVFGGGGRGGNAGGYGAVLDGGRRSFATSRSGRTGSESWYSDLASDNSTYLAGAGGRTRGNNENGGYYGGGGAYPKDRTSGYAL